MSTFINGTLSQTLIIGFVGNDPTISYTTTGKAVVRFSLATNKRPSNTKNTLTEWHQVVMWDKMAEVCKEHVHKGRKLLVQGEMRTRSWKDGEVTRYMTELHANSFQFMDAKKDVEVPEQQNEELPPETDIVDDLPQF